MGAARLNIEIEQGADFQMAVLVVGGPVSLTGYTGAMQIRQMKSSTEVLYEVSPDDITVDDPSRTVTVKIPYRDTAGFLWNNAAYDVYIISGDESDAYRVAEGKVTMDYSVTREDA